MLNTLEVRESCNTKV